MPTKRAPYIPANISPLEWEHIGEFVLAAAEDAAPHVRYTATKLTLYAAGLTRWAVMTAGHPLERVSVFHRATIGDYIARGGVSVRSAATIRAALLRMSEVLLPAHLQSVRLAPLPGSLAVAPYSRTQITAIKSWAGGLPTQYLRTSAQLMLALGFGAGLSGGEISRARARDIRLDDQGVMVEVRVGRPRFVPVLAEWEPVLADYARLSHASPDLFVFGSRRRVAHGRAALDFVMRHNGNVESRRMRVTWIIRHLTLGVPPHILIDAAGVDSFESFGRYLPFMPIADPTWARRLLRGRADEVRP